MCASVFIKEETDKQNENGRIGRQAGPIANDPVESDTAVILGTEALSAESDVREGAKESSKDSLNVCIPSEKRVRGVRKMKGFECRQEGFLSSTDYFKRRVVVNVVRHCC